LAKETGIKKGKNKKEGRIVFIFPLSNKKPPI